MNQEASILWESMKGWTDEVIRVRYGETDKMGHAYYANYLFWFEQLRNAWCRERGLPYREMEERGWFMPCVEARLRYKGEILYDDLITVRGWISQVRRASLRFDYRIYREERMVTEGYTWHVVMGFERRAISIPDELMQWMRVAGVGDPAANPDPVTD